MLKEDKRLTIRHIAETTDIHATTVHRIVSDDLGMKNVWVPRMLTDEQMQNHVDVCIDLLSRLQAQPRFFLHRIVMQEEAWVDHFDPETKQQTMVWKRQFFHP